MKKRDVVEARRRLEAFVGPLLQLLGRSERRQWGAVYLQGLLLEGGRKTAAGIARRLQGDEQALQQFLSQSPWDWEVVRRELAVRTVGLISSPRCGWIVDDTGFPKKGQHSVGVARQYSGTLGKVGNCQVATSLNYATEDASIPLDFSLYMPNIWMKDRKRCKKAGVPRDHVFRKKWQLALDMIDRAVAWGISQGVVVADAGYGSVVEFRSQLRERGLPYVLGVQGSTAIWLTEIKAHPPSYQGRGRPRTLSRDLPTPEAAVDVAMRLPDTAWQEITWRQGSRGGLTSRFAVLRAQPAHGHTDGKVLEPYGWLLVEWPSESEKPSGFWVSDLPENTLPRALVYWAKMRWWVEQNYQQLKDQLGLDHFEGRSWTGWHHHVTLTMIAYNFLVLESLRAKKNYWVDLAPNPSGTGEAGHPDLPWFLSNV